MRMEIPAAVMEEVQMEAVAAYPRECCGLLIGSVDGQRVIVRRAVLSVNMETARQHDRYTIDPRVIMAADRAARGEGQDVVGVYHSHPDHPARASTTDAELAWEGYVYLIVSVMGSDGGRIADCRAWRFPSHGIPEEVIVAVV